MEVTMRRRIQIHREQADTKADITAFLAVFLLIAIRFLYFGFQYFPQLDDYIQHHNYAAQGDLLYNCRVLGLLASRPLAGILDVTLWSWLWPCSIIGVLLLSALYALSAVVFQKLFSKLFGTGAFFLVVYTLLPLGIEGTYWMSASTRIVPGLLFVALSANCFYQFLEAGRKRDLILAVLCQFITFCFYEQTAVLSCALNLLIAFLYVRKSGGRWLFAFSCFLCAALYFGLCALTVDSALYSGRMSLILPVSNYYYDTFLPDLLSQMKSAFLGGGFYTLVYGFLRGIMQIFADGAWLYCLLVLIFCAGFFLHFRKDKSKGEERFLLPLLFGILLAIAPLVPFLIIENPWFSLRGTVTSFVGIALLADLVLRRIAFSKKNVAAAVSAFVALIFCICSVSELADYKATYAADSRVVGTVAQIASEYPEGGKVAILNIDDSYVHEQNYKFHEHVSGVTSSDWALTGAVRCYNENPNEWITYVPISLRKQEIYQKWEWAVKTISSMDGVYVYEYTSNTIEPLTVQYEGKNSFLLYRADGRLFGRIVEEEQRGYFYAES